MNLEQLLHPELLDENELRGVLKERFIRVDNIENLNKEQLLGLFYRVATPLQQRMRNDNRKLNGAQSAAAVTPESVFATKTSKSPQKSTPENGNCIKKIKLYNNKAENAVNNHKVHLKRTHNDGDGKSIDKEEVPSNKKTRQKICWP